MNDLTSGSISRTNYDEVENTEATGEPKLKSKFINACEVDYSR